MANRRPLYSDRDIADMHFVYGFCNGNARAAEREYHRRFPNRVVPHHTTFTAIHLRLTANGIRSQPAERIHGGNLHNEEEVLRLIFEDPRLSTRRIAIRLNMRYWTVWKILKREGLHPYHFRRVQNITDPDYAARSAFSAWINLNVRENPNFLARILWTDEASFTRAGITNYRNLHAWSADNPHLVRPSSFQHEFSVNVWAGIIGNHLVGPVQLPHRLNGPRFLEFLQNIFRELLWDIPLDNRRRMWLQLDGAPAHFAVAVRQHLDENYPQWIGRGGRVAWPPRSPDFTPLDYFLWGWMKQKVYFTPINTREELINRIQVAADEIRADPDALSRATQQVGLRAIACLQNRGGHFEQMLK